MDSVGLNDPNTKQNSGLNSPKRGMCMKVVSVSQRLFHWKTMGRSSGFTVHMLSTLSGFCTSVWKIFSPNMLTQSVGQKADSVTLSHTHAHLNASQGCGIQFRKAMPWWILTVIHYFFNSAAPISLSRWLVYCITCLQDYDSSWRWIFHLFTSVDNPRCYLDDVTALAQSLGLSSTRLSPDKSHSGSRSQQKAVRKRIEPASVEGGSADWP